MSSMNEANNLWFLQGTILRIEFKHDLIKKIVHGMEPQKTNPILLHTSLDPLALYSSNANISSWKEWLWHLLPWVKEDWQFSLLQWTTTCAISKLSTFNSHNINTYGWFKIATNDFMIILRNTSFTSNPTIQFGDLCYYAKCQIWSSSPYCQLQSHPMTFAFAQEHPMCSISNMIENHFLIHLFEKSSIPYGCAYYNNKYLVPHVH